MKLSQKYILSILFNEMDAFKFRNVIFNAKHMSKDNVYMLMAALYSGDYQTLVNICVKKLHEKAMNKNKYTYLVFLAHAYFQLRDDQKLAEVCTFFERLVSADKNKGVITKHFPSMNFYSCFLNKEYDKCKIICNEETYLETSILQITGEFNYAVSCFNNGELQAAECCFKKIIEKAPKMHFCILSQNYLQEIEGNNKQTNSEILPENTSVLSGKKKLQIRYTAIVLFFIILISASFGNLYITQKKDFEYKLKNALSDVYAEYQIIENFELKKDGKKVDNICVVTTDEELIDVWLIKTNDKGESFHYFDAIRGAIEDQYYCIKSATSDYYIGLQLYNNKAEIPEKYYKIVDFTMDNDEYYMCFDYIENEPYQ